MIYFTFQMFHVVAAFHKHRHDAGMGGCGMVHTQGVLHHIEICVSGKAHTRQLSFFSSAGDLVPLWRRMEMEMETRSGQLE